MAAFIANARMYAVTPEVEEAWKALLGHVFAMAGTDFDYVPYPAPQPLEVLWEREDLGCVFMCGYPIAFQLSAVVPIAAPIPAGPWAGGKPLYRSDLIVRADSPFQRIEDTFGHRIGWTVEHSHSGFNALRHHLLAYRTPDRPTLYAQVRGNLVTARGILDKVLAGEIDVGPLDAYWHDLIRAHRPDLTDGIRVIGSTGMAPIPSFVAVPGLPAETVLRLKAAFAAAHRQPWFADLAATLRLQGFAAVEQDDFATTLAWDREARDRGYPTIA
ncbi:phosphate/phosphite/phosphonate ABC transporter substrate-binding protein [Labrys monachus]|uniref:ABC-type phosphate/phosphonate transport system substrate-binding protein n=1 Tax=Labrys monachus TaxID=217067 RepID=A0ABU0F9L5_9HYPH|nr:PhnD/SsuA/transferrin family substrate-binding protein [Labrys monachus]MDQ0390750.1 ABC-type phosphate/phosphonate transport system substrate-binding protein [Labrys monachus]